MYPNKNAECKWNDCKIPKSPWDVEIFSDEKKVVGMLFGPHKDGQSLYFINHFPGGKSGEAIFRMSFTGESNRDPKSRISADRTVGFVPFTVQFDGTSSYDPDAGDSLTYEWDLDGDGEVDSTDASPEYTYMVAGSFEVTLRVSDGRGGKSSRTSIRIDVDNSPPLPKIESIAPGTTFAVGDIFTLTGTAWDAEDGILPDSALTWEVRQMHNNHYHPFLDPTSGNNIVISEAPSPEDFFYLTTTTSYLSVHLTATDSQGLSATTIVDIQPRLVNLVFETEPDGLPLLINQDKYETPVSIVGWEGDRFEIEAASLLSQEDGEKIKFVSWSDGRRENAREFVVPSESDPEPIVASFEREVPEEAIYDPEEHDGDGDEDVALSPIPIGDKNDEPKKSTKFVVGLLDTSVSVRFTNDIARRRRLAGDSNVDLVTLLEDELKMSVSDAVSSAVALAINFPGSDYAPLHGIRFARKGENALTDSDGLLYTSTFGGLAIFDRDDDLQSVPDAFAMQSAQVKALDAVEDELKSDLREFISEAGGIALGYQHVRSVSAEVIGKASVGPSTTSSSNDEKDPILTGLLVIAILLVLVVAAGGLGYYYMRRRSGKKPRKVRRDDIPLHDVERNEGEEKKTTQHDKSSCGSETDDETPANSPTKAAYRYDPADPYGYSSGVKNSYTHGNDDESDDGASVNTSAAGSVASSIQQITRDMISQLNSVLGGPDDDDDDDAIQNGEEETHANANASLASVFGRKLD